MLYSRGPQTARQPNGQPKREPREYPPTQIKRLRDAAVRGMRDAEWGTELGRLSLQGKITNEMHAAGRIWREQAHKYASSIGVFPVRSAKLELGSKANAPDPESPEGQKLVRRDANAAEVFFAAHARLTAAGAHSERSVRSVCEQDTPVCGQIEYRALRRGLDALASHYNLTRSAKRV